GQQFKVTEGQELFVHQLEAASGASVSFDQVFLVDNNGSVRVGTPVLSNAKVNATVIGNQKGDKVVVFKKKRRKGYQKKNGVGSSDNGRDSNSKRLGVKLFGGQYAKAGNILVRQRGTKFHAGENAYLGKDFTIHANVAGIVTFRRGKNDRT
ncbi:unnamed protein product, partial [Darwinula stevensoni]